MKKVLSFLLMIILLLIIRLEPFADNENIFNFEYDKYGNGTVLRSFAKPAADSKIKGLLKNQHESTNTGENKN